MYITLCNTCYWKGDHLVDYCWELGVAGLEEQHQLDLPSHLFLNDVGDVTLLINQNVPVVSSSLSKKRRWNINWNVKFLPLFIKHTLSFTIYFIKPQIFLTNFNQRITKNPSGNLESTFYRNERKEACLAWCSLCLKSVSSSQTGQRENMTNFSVV